MSASAVRVLCQAVGSFNGCVLTLGTLERDDAGVATHAQVNYTHGANQALLPSPKTAAFNAAFLKCQSPNPLCSRNQLIFHVTSPACGVLAPTPVERPGKFLL